jgi:hypothetical protein
MHHASPLLVFIFDCFDCSISTSSVFALPGIPPYRNMEYLSFTHSCCAFRSTDSCCNFSRLCAELGLPGLPPSMTEICRHKPSFRQFCADNDIPAARCARPHVDSMPLSRKPTSQSPGADAIILFDHVVGEDSSANLHSVSAILIASHSLSLRRIDFSLSSTLADTRSYNLRRTWTL